MKKVLLTMLVVMLALPAFARDFNYTYKGQTITYTVIDEDAKTVKTKEGARNNAVTILWYPASAGNEVSGKLLLPSNPKDGDQVYTLIEIGQGGFYECRDLTSVTIPESVTEIGIYAFSQCRNLISVTIPESVTEIGMYAFSQCRNLISVTIPESVTSIGGSAFQGCTSLTSVTIPNSVTEIGTGAFTSCSGLTSVTIPNSVTEIRERVFSNCSKLTSVTIPNSVTSIGYSAFEGCSSLTSVTIPNSVISIGSEAFKGCTGLKKCAYPNTLSTPPCGNIYSLAYNPESSVVEDQFVYNSDKTKVLFAPCSINNTDSIPESVKTIGEYAYSYCDNMTSIVIPDNVTAIYEYAFWNCSKLTDITLPAALESLGESVFEGSKAIEKVVYMGQTPIEATEDVFESDVYKNATLYVHKDNISSFKEVSPWKYFSTIAESEDAGIEEVSADFDATLPYGIYNLSGVKLGDNINGLTPGIYIICQGTTVKKIAVK